ncbi:MAG: flavin reductase family protein [Thermoplasmata archaeon]|nr:flavin reductase family protein [Thermoplasmata archaeon]
MARRMTPPALDTLAFRRLMARWPTGVAVVTAREKDHDYGLTVNALLSVSLEPPTLLISLTEIADTTPVIARTGAFGVSFLSAAQRDLSDRFARTIPPEEKFRELAFVRGTLGPALLQGATATLECRVRQTVPLLDHTLFAGEVVAVGPGEDATPLVFHRSSYGEAAGETSVKLPAAGPRHA